MAAEIGRPAPPFALPDVDREMVHSESLKGRKSLVVFIPFPFTRVCDGEACAIRDNLARLEELDAHVVVVTTHAVPTNGAWAEKEGFGFPVLSDYWPHGAVAKAYGCFDERFGCATRATYVLDAEGIVRDVIATASMGDARTFADCSAALEAIG